MAKDTVSVYCGLPNGLTLRTFERKETDPGVHQAIPDTMMVTLNAGQNEGVDKAFFEKWLQQNHDNDVVVNGLVSLGGAETAPTSDDAGAAALAATETVGPAAGTQEEPPPSGTGPVDAPAAGSVESGGSADTVLNPNAAPADESGNMRVSPPQASEPAADNQPKSHNKVPAKRK